MDIRGKYRDLLPTLAIIGVLSLATAQVLRDSSLRIDREVSGFCPQLATGTRFHIRTHDLHLVWVKCNTGNQTND